VPLAEIDAAVLYSRQEVYDFTRAAPLAPVSLLYNELLQLVNATTETGV